jgi:hypothetical protein
MEMLDNGINIYLQLVYFFTKIFSCCVSFSLQNILSVELLYEHCCNEELKEQVPQNNYDDKGFNDQESDQDMEEQTAYSCDSEADIQMYLNIVIMKMHLKVFKKVQFCFLS